MFKYLTSITARQLLTDMQKAGQIKADGSETLERFILSMQQEKELPLYLRILVGVGAFIASLCFIGFLISSETIDLDSAISLISAGLLFIGTALGLTKLPHDKNSTIRHSFLIQLSFCAIAIGKLLFAGGFTQMFGHQYDAWGVTFATTLITAATYPIYRMSIDRFLSSFAALTSLLIAIIADPRLGASSKEFVLSIFFATELLLAAFLLTHSRIKSDYLPLAYAIICSLASIIIVFTSPIPLPLKAHYSFYVINTLLTFALIALIAWAAGNAQKLKTEPLILASISAALLGVISAPGVLLSLCLLILGYAKHERLLLLLGILLMPLYLFLYYYNLHASLLVKSSILIGSGILLLTARAYLRFRKLDQEI